MRTDKAGRIVWHDLFTDDRSGSMLFYERVASWNYIIEHTAKFAWGGGQKDYVLALSEGEAGAGFAETPAGFQNGWITYVEVSNVDTTATLAVKLGGEIVRQPFEVPGVGRNALVRDPLGALIGITLSRHNFPMPTQQFGIEHYLSQETEFPEEFYAQLFGWKKAYLGVEQSRSSIVTSLGEEVALHVSGLTALIPRATWVPSIKGLQPHISTIDAGALEGEAFNMFPDVVEKRLGNWLYDPNGAIFSLVTAQNLETLER